MAAPRPQPIGFGDRKPGLATLGDPWRPDGLFSKLQEVLQLSDRESTGIRDGRQGRRTRPMMGVQCYRKDEICLAGNFVAAHAGSLEKTMRLGLVKRFHGRIDSRETVARATGR